MEKKQSSRASANSARQPQHQGKSTRGVASKNSKTGCPLEHSFGMNSGRSARSPTRCNAGGPTQAHHPCMAHLLPQLLAVGLSKELLFLASSPLRFELCGREEWDRVRRATLLWGALDKSVGVTRAWLGKEHARLEDALILLASHTTQYQCCPTQCRWFPTKLAGGQVKRCSTTLQTRLIVHDTNCMTRST